MSKRERLSASDDDSFNTGLGEATLIESEEKGSKSEKEIRKLAVASTARESNVGNRLEKITETVAHKGGNSVNNSEIWSDDATRRGVDNESTLLSARRVPGPDSRHVQGVDNSENAEDSNHIISLDRYGAEESSPQSSMCSHSAEESSPQSSMCSHSAEESSPQSSMCSHSAEESSPQSSMYSHSAEESDLENSLGRDDSMDSQSVDHDDVDLSCGIGPLRSTRMGDLLANIYVFAVCFGLSNFFTSMVGQVIQTQLTSLERQFNIDNTRAGLFETASRVGFISTIFFAGHFAKKSHIPLVVGVSGVVQGLVLIGPAIMQFADPYELPYIPAPSGDNSSNSSDRGDNIMYLCVNYNWTNDTDGASNSTSEAKQAAFVILLLVQAVKGVTDTFHSAFLPALYMDDNLLDKTRMATFLGIWQFIVELSGPIGKQINGFLTTIPVDLKESEITPKNEMFVAAWWLAFLIFGIGTASFSLPIMMFPRRLVSTKQRRQALQDAVDSFSGHSSESTDKARSNPLRAVLETSDDSVAVSETTADHEPLINKQIASEDESVKDLLTDFPKALYRIIRKPVFMLLLINIVVVTIPVSGISVFRSTYIANEFNVPMSTVAMVTGITTAVGHISGAVVSSWMSRRVKTRLGYIWIITGSCSVTLTITPLYFIFGCSNEVVFGDDGKYGRAVNLTDCYCNSSKQLLSCGADGNNYLSPCYAGCTDVHGEIFTDCSALNTSSGHTVTPGLCPTSCQENFVVYCALHGLQTFFSSLERIPSRLLILRMVDPEDRGFATSFFMFVSVLVAIPAPNLFGNVIDSTCLIWDGNFCALYDRDKIRYLISGVDLAVQVYVQVTCIIMICIFRREERKARKTGDMN